MNTDRNHFGFIGVDLCSSVVERCRFAEDLGGNALGLNFDSGSFAVLSGLVSASADPASFVVKPLRVIRGGPLDSERLKVDARTFSR